MMPQLLLALVLLAVPAPEDDPCILGLEAIRGQLDHTAEGVTTLADPARVERQLTEAIRLGDGTVVKFQIGGCVHYGFSFTYPAVELADQGFPSASTRAGELLRRTPVREDAAANVELLLRALASPHDTPAGPGETYLGCGDAVCSLLVTPDEQSGTVTLTVSYDFPL